MVNQYDFVGEKLNKFWTGMYLPRDFVRDLSVKGISLGQAWEAVQGNASHVATFEIFMNAKEIVDEKHEHMGDNYAWMS